MNDDRMICEVFEKMRNNPDLAGSFECADGAVVWRLFDGYTVEIAQGYISINKPLFGDAVESIYHWHPEDEDLYDEVCRLGTRGNVTVIHRLGWRGMLGSGCVYSGPRSECPERRKWFFGKLIYLYAR